MKSTRIYDQYTQAVDSLTDLYRQYRNASDQKTRDLLQLKIDNCRNKLTEITDKLINENPFMKGNRLKSKSH